MHTPKSIIHKGANQNGKVFLGAARYKIIAANQLSVPQYSKVIQKATGNSYLKWLKLIFMHDAR
jgi:hypothetical protein